MTSETAYIRPKDIDQRATLRQRIVWRFEALCWDVFYWYPMSIFKPETASNIAGVITRRIGPLLRQHKIMLGNLKEAYPDWSKERIHETALEAWENVGRTAGELPHLKKLKPYTTDSAIDVVNAEAFDEISKDSKGAVIVTGHFANWEVIASAICNRPLDCVITYRALNNPYIDRRLSKARRAYGVTHLAPKGIGARALMRSLQQGEAVAFLNDQKFREGLPIRFFEREAMTATGPARLAMKYGVPILPISTERTGPARFRVVVHDRIWPQDTGVPEADLKDTVTRITQFIEARIRENPGQWFWMHQRWPKRPRSDRRKP